MKHQRVWWLFVCLLFVGFHTVDSQRPLALGLHKRYPDMDESVVCGRIRDVIPRDSGRFRRILIRNENNQVYYSDEDSRRMTSRTKSKLDILASLVPKEDDWRRIRVTVLLAWTDQVDPSDPTSLHYEGRSVRLELSDKDPLKLGRLAGLALEAGFDWVEYTSSSYIRASVIPDVCQASVDLVFLLDGSGSVGEDNFDKVREFVKRVVDFFNVGETGTHIAVVTYDSSVRTEFNLRQYYTKSELRNAVDRIEYFGYLTYTGEALDHVRTAILTPSAGMRTDPGVPKVLILLTDGRSNGATSAVSAAKTLRDNGVSIFSIGVGDVSQTELNGIATDPDKDYVFLLQGFSDLSGLVDRISSVSCNEGSLINSCDSAVASVESGSFKYFRTEFQSATNDQVIVEVRDEPGSTSYLYVSTTSRNPGPLDPDSLKNEDDVSPRAVSIQLQGTKIVFVAVQGQKPTNQFTLSFWDNLFEKSVVNVTRKENQPAGIVTELQLKPHSYSLDYRISDGNDDGAFRIDSDKPRIYARDSLDYEKTSRYDLVIVADDKTNKCHKSRALVQLNVIDENDNAPQFTANEYTGMVDENAIVGKIVSAVTATDADSGVNGQISYSITSALPPPNPFQIDNGGYITVKAQLDHETVPFYTLTVEAADGGSPSLTNTAKVRINVLNVNENPSISCNGSCIMTVKENAKPGVKIGGVVITDPDTSDNCAHQYDIPSSVKEKFEVLSNGSVQTKSSLDREVFPQYVFFVTVRDCGSPPLTDSVRVTVTVEDVNDNPPLFHRTYTVEILENKLPGSNVVQVKATDADEGNNAEIRYSLSGNDSSAFEIEPASGRITTKNVLDYETRQSYSFTVTATDQGPGNRSDTTTVNVNVKDINDNGPQFIGAPYNVRVLEGAAVGTLVIDANATDIDSGNNGEVRYSIVSGNVGEAFSISSVSGEITVKSGLDRETRSFYSLLIQASDRGSPSRNSRTTVAITVSDGNDNVPIFQGLPYTKTVSENTGAGQFVLKVSATDNDDGKFGQVNYTIESPPVAQETFEVDSDGNIRLKKKLDYETRKDYTFTVVATDGGGSKTPASVRIFVEDFNDNAPRFDQNFTAQVAENVNVGFVVKAVQASDADSGPRGRVIYSIISGNDGNAFAISASGTVTVASGLDRETQETYSLTIKAKDEGSPSLSSTTRMDITVTDINDNRPTFGNTFYYFTISENNSPGAVVGNPGPASDADKGVNAEIEYSIVSGDPNQAFEFEPSGKLIAKKVLDREVVPSYTIVLEAKDKGSPAQSVRLPIRVAVLDQNDNGPEFSQNTYQCTISENSAQKSFVCSVFASDKDDGQNGAVTYELVSPSAQFSVDQNTGEIKTVVTLDREEQPSYSFGVRAKDGGSPSQNATATVMVQVIDKNDNEPVFNQSSYVFDVSEDAVVTTAVGSVLAQDKDEGSNGQVVYSITGGNTNTAFEINAASGNITVKSALDRETLAKYTLTVQASDRGSPALSSSTVVTINVKDVNDNDPIFTQSQYDGVISEDASIGSAVEQVKANDADDGLNGRIKYNITGGDKKEDFSIDEDTGVIRTASLLDYETKKSYLLDVRANDGGSPSRFGTSRVNITVRNTNDNAPKFTPGSPTASVSELVAVGTQVVQFNAVDDDGNALMFSITSGNTGDALKIDRVTGVLTTNKSLDRETVPRYNLTVTVTDNGGQSSSKNLTVIVLDENDNTPVFEPSSYTKAVTENSPAGPVVTVTATDKDEGDNAKISYSIDGASAAKFNINSTTGVISTKSPLDHEESPRYLIRVTARDSGSPSLSSVAMVEVSVTDTNDNDPSFPSDYTTSLLENTAKGKLVLRVKATDPDSGVNGEIQYNITSGNEEGFFSLDPNDGSITIAKPPDREANPSFTLTILAQNKVPSTGSAPSTKTSTTVTITIEDVNDNAPEITNDVDTVQLQENSKQSAQVFDVNATDRDTGVNSQIKYEITSGNVNDAFAIDSGSGVVTVTGAIDREVIGQYTLKIRASDNGKPSLFTEKDFVVNVTDVDDNPPEFSAVSYNPFVAEDVNVSTFVIQVQATDKDTGPNGKVAYSLNSSNDLGHFKIDPVTGEIRTNAPLDYESVTGYVFVVTARDTLHSVTANLTIGVININDNSPVFNPDRYNVSIPENDKLNKGFLTLKATDKDPFTGLRYAIIDGNLGNKFGIDPINGELSVVSELDRETTDVYNLTVRVTDGGVPALSDIGFVVVHVADVNDNPPKFNTTVERRSVKENSRVGEEVITVRATDKDAGRNAEIHYNLTKNEPLFHLDQITGVLSVAGNIDREKNSSFVLEIVARDLGSPPLTSETLRVEIAVLDENDNDPVFRQEIYRQNIRENLSPGTFVKGLEATDEDLGLNGQVVYSIRSGHLGHFAIGNVTGIVTTTVPLDRENISSYTMIVEARDLGNPSRNSTAMLVVEEIDTNDNPPVFTLSSLRVNVTEEQPRGHYVTQIAATDRDLGFNSEVEYTLTPRGNQSLAIDPSTGVVTTRVPFDYEQQRNHTFKITVSDKGSPPLSTTAELFINVIDIDDNCPVFNPKEYNVTIQENKPSNETIVRVYATDVDTVNARALDYGIRSGNLASTFEINPVTGELTSSSLVDREISAEYNLIVRAGSDFCGVNASDDIPESSFQELSKSIAYVNVFVTDVNDNAPVFLQSPYKYELQDIYASNLLRVNATDKDEGKNAEVTYSLHSVKREQSKRTLTVIATDKGVPSLSSNTTIEVTGKDCGAMSFSVSADGNVTAKTLCRFDRVEIETNGTTESPATLYCSAQGNTVAKYEWTKNGDRSGQISPNKELHIASLSKNDAGKYACIASSEAGNILSKPIDLIVKEPPKIVVHPKDTWVEAGKKATLSCLATGDEPMRYTWFKGDVKFLSSGSLIADRPNLVFDEVVVTDDAIYHCEAENNVGKEPAKSSRASLKVFTLNSVVEMEFTVNKPDEDKSCLLFNLTNIKDTVTQITQGEIGVIELNKPKSICNVTACSSNPCQNRGSCMAKDSGFSCSCLPGWTGRLCEVDINECEDEKLCKNRGKCVNRRGSFSCVCRSGISGKQCEFKDADCDPNPCNSSDKCFPTELGVGHECISNPRTVDMVFKLDESRRPWQDPMKYDVAYDIREAIVNRQDAVTKQGSKGRRRRREAVASDFSACSIRVQKFIPRETEVELTIVSVCAEAPSKTFVCDAVMADNLVSSCTGDKGIVTPTAAVPKTTVPPVNVIVVFVARNSAGERFDAGTTISMLREDGIEAKLEKFSITDVQLRARVRRKVREDSEMSSGAIAGVVFGILAVIIVAIIIAFVFVRTRRRSEKKPSIINRAFSSRTSSSQLIMKRDISMKELKSHDARGVINRSCSEIDEGAENPEDLEDVSFMVENHELALHRQGKTVDRGYMKELESSPWFHGSISRSKAEDLLDENGDEGWFLVRAGLDEREFYISAKASKDSPSFRHLAVNRREDMFVTVCGPQSDAMQFGTFRELIDYLHSTPTSFDFGPDLLLSDYVEKN